MLQSSSCRAISMDIPDLLLSKQMIKRYGANVSPCSTPTTMSKSSVSPSGEHTFTLVFLYWGVLVV